MYIRPLLLIALAVFLVWEIVTRGIPAYLAENSPQTAVRLRATQPTALVNLAAKELEKLNPQPDRDRPSDANSDGRPGKMQEQTPPEQQALRSEQTDVSSTEAQTKALSLAERALINDPLYAHAFGILGQLALQRSDLKRTETFMHAAAKRSLFESDAVSWMMYRSYETHDYAAALQYANALLRTRQGVLSRVMPILAMMTENPAAVPELRTALRGNPVWRQGFFSALPSKISDARSPLVLLLSLKNSSAPPRQSELVSYLTFLVQHKLYDLAYYTWLQFLPADQLQKVGNIFNGSFEFDASGIPFDWTWTEKPGARIEISRLPDQEPKQALHVELGPGRVDFPGVKELVMLPPGSYQFRAKYTAEIIGKRGLLWRVRCAGKNGSALGESEPILGHQADWQSLQFSFNVPKADCPAQYVVLDSGARSSSEQFITGSAWFDELKIVNETVVAPSL
jgi:hypothetical protein